MSIDDQNVLKKRVTPYPFPIQISQSEGGEIKNGRVVKLTQVGFLVEFPSFLPIVGKEYMAEFSLPTFKDQILVRVLVVKTYDSYRSKEHSSSTSDVNEGTGEPVGNIHLAEMHFKKQSLIQKKSILKWLMKIKQVK